MKMTILKKLLAIMIILTVVPLATLGYFSLNDAKKIGLEAANDANMMGQKNLASAKSIGEIAVADSKNALIALAKEAIEVRAVETANKIADFLKERDNDVLIARYLERNNETYAAFISSKKKEVNYDGNRFSKPIYKEIAFLDASGTPMMKITAEGYDGKDYSLEDMQAEIADLAENEIYVSRLWGDYVGIKEAYAGVENPKGQRYEGYYRWVAPIYEKGKRIGYVSLKLDARHIIEFSDHLSPTEERFIDTPDALSGNYAYIVDDESWLIAHVREYHIKGVFSDGTLAIPFDTDPKAIPARNNTKALMITHLASLSKELAEIHTVYVTNGSSGSQVYQWAGLTKWIAYSPIPYHTGKNYNDDKIGFGWIAVGAEIDKFKEPAVKTETEINSKIDAQSAEIKNASMETEGKIRAQTESMGPQNTILVITLITMAATLVISIAFANRISKPIKQLKEAADKLTNGEFDTQLPQVKGNDEVAELTGSMEMLIAAYKMKSGKQ
jgi:HAMP domain-containing protein